MNENTWNLDLLNIKQESPRQMRIWANNVVCERGQMIEYSDWNQELLDKRWKPSAINHCCQIEDWTAGRCIRTWYIHGMGAITLTQNRAGD